MHVEWRVAGYNQQLGPGERIEPPKVFTGVLHGALDDLRHQLLDYQYRYKWDYTRAPYFAGTEMEPTWVGSSWAGSGFNPVTLVHQVFHMADLRREVGADIYWRDNVWWDNEGDWNGPDWGETGRYLAQYGMQQIIYLPIQDASPKSRVFLEHPEWTMGRSTAWAGIISRTCTRRKSWRTCRTRGIRIPMRKPRGAYACGHASLPRGETDDPAKREGLRELFDIYHYLLHQKVMGRWAWVYHPQVTGDPKGLHPEVIYNVSYQESGVVTNRSGADLTTHGISLNSVPDGELIDFNLPLHPGNAVDRTPPTAPSHVVQTVATRMDFTGIESPALTYMGQ